MAVTDVFPGWKRLLGVTELLVQHNGSESLLGRL